MKTIWKYEIEPGKNKILMPAWSQVLSVQVQQGKVCMWAMVDTKTEKKERIFYTYATGQKIDKDNLVFIGTFQVEEETLVFHLFEKIEEKNKDHH